MNNRLYRSRTNRMLGGICGGLGEYLKIDPTIVRIFFVLLMVQGIGVLVYFVLWIILPYQDKANMTEHAGFISSDFSSRTKEMGEDFQQAVHNPNPALIKFIGVGLIAAGVFLVLENLNIFWLGWINSNVMWSMLLIAAGLLFLYRSIRN